MRNVSLSLAAVALLATTAWAGDCCERCGCESCCRKVCRLVCESKKVSTTVYDCECEDFCVPHRSECIGTKCECEPRCCDCPKCHEAKIYRPTCADIHTRTKLIKRTETKEVPSYKWVVETVCDHCASCTSCAANDTQVEPTAENTMAAAPQPAPVKKASFFNSLFGKKPASD